MSEHRNLVRSASLITTLTFLSRIFGYIRDSRIAYLLGAKTVGDAFWTAYLIPNLLRRLVGEGAVSAAFIPVFSKYLANEDKKKQAWEFANAMLSVLTIALTAVTVLGIVFSPFVVWLFASGYRETPGKIEITTYLTRIMFPYISLISLSALGMGILNSFHRFATPAFAPVMLNISVIAFSFFAGWFSDPSVALAVGVVVGGVLQVAIQVPPLLRAGWRPRFRFDLSHPGVRRVGTLMLPVAFGVGVVQINVLVSTQFASYLVEGSMAALTLADRVMELVLGGYAIALSTAILPLLSRQAAQRRMEEMKSTINFGTRLILFITVPSTVGLIVLRKEIIEVLFQRGDFDAQSTALTAWPLLFFAIGLSAFSMVKIIVPAFYALHDTRTPVRIAFIAMFVNIGLNFLFIRPLENGGPAFATSLAAFFNFISLMVIFHRRYGSLDVEGILHSLAKFLGAGAALGVVAVAIIEWPGFYAGPLGQKVIALSIAIVAAAGAYLSAVLLLRAREAGELRELLFRRSKPAVEAASEQSGMD